MEGRYDVHVGIVYASSVGAAGWVVSRSFGWEFGGQGRVRTCLVWTVMGRCSRARRQGRALCSNCLAHPTVSAGVLAMQNVAAAVTNFKHNAQICPRGLVARFDGMAASPNPDRTASARRPRSRRAGQRRAACCRTDGGHSRGRQREPPAAPRNRRRCRGLAGTGRTRSRRHAGRRPARKLSKVYRGLTGGGVP
jgi:hypothetical protein